MEYYFPLTENEFSQKKLEEYEKLEKIINQGRRNPIWFIEEFFGTFLIDYQKLMFMNSWYRKYVLWLCSRRAGKSTTAAVFLMAKMLLFPDSKWYISTNSAAQSIEIFKMLEDIALKRVPTFAKCTDFFAEEVRRSNNSETGFLHAQSGYSFTLYNNSRLETLSTNNNANRGKDGNVLFDEVGWQTDEQMATLEHYADTDSSFATGLSAHDFIPPKQPPKQLLYASSAGDIEFPFYRKYKHFAMKMLEGDDNYFACDINVNTILHFSTVNGTKIESHITQESVDKAFAEDPEKAERELFNKFRVGGGQNAVVKMENFTQNSETRVPLLLNDTGTKKFILCYDTARAYDGSILSVYQIIKGKEGYYLQIENCISMFDINSPKKTPLPFPEQLAVLKEQMIRYNGIGCPEWSNIKLYIDAGAGGGALGGIADNLADNWRDSQGHLHRGVIDPVHKQYETYRQRYKNADKIVRLIEPVSYKKVMYDALEKMSAMNLIKYTNYDGKEFIMVPDAEKNGEFKKYILSTEERLALVNIELLKTETSYMCRYDTSKGNVQYELARDKKNTMHDDRAYTNAMAAYALALKRRTELLPVNDNKLNANFYRQFSRKTFNI